MENYLSIEQTVEYTNKSISSVRRLVKELKQNKSKYIKLEKLKTGHDKVFISIEYLNNHFNINSSTNDSTSNSTNSSNDTFVNKTLELFSIFYKSDGFIVQGYILKKKNLDKKVPVIIYCRGGNNIEQLGEIEPRLQIQQKQFIYMMANSKLLPLLNQRRPSLKFIK